jgi:hypothetical protein
MACVAAGPTIRRKTPRASGMESDARRDGESHSEQRSNCEAVPFFDSDRGSRARECRPRRHRSLRDTADEVQEDPLRRLVFRAGVLEDPVRQQHGRPLGHRHRQRDVDRRRLDHGAGTADSSQQPCPPFGGKGTIKGAKGTIYFTVVSGAKGCGDDGGHNFSLVGYLLVTKATGALAKAKGQLRFTGSYSRDDGTFSIKLTGTLKKPLS